APPSSTPSTPVVSTPGTAPVSPAPEPLGPAFTLLLGPTLPGGAEATPSGTAGVGAAPSAVAAATSAAAGVSFGSAQAPSGGASGTSLAVLSASLGDLGGRSGLFAGTQTPAGLLQGLAAGPVGGTGNTAAPAAPVLVRLSTPDGGSDGSGTPQHPVGLPDGSATIGFAAAVLRMLQECWPQVNDAVFSAAGMLPGAASWGPLSRPWARGTRAPGEGREEAETADPESVTPDEEGAELDGAAQASLFLLAVGGLTQAAWSERRREAPPRLTSRQRAGA